MAFSHNFWPFPNRRMTSSSRTPTTFPAAQSGPTGRRHSWLVEIRPRCTGLAEAHSLSLTPYLLAAVPFRLHFLMTRSLRRQLSAIRDQFFLVKKLKNFVKSPPCCTERAPIQHRVDRRVS